VGTGLPKVSKSTKGLLKTKLFQGSVVVLVGTTIINLLNYLYHLVIGRYLNPNEYGLIQSLISLTYFMSVLVGAFNLSVTELIAKVKDNQVWSWINRLKPLVFKGSLLLWVGVLSAYPFLTKALNINNFVVYLIFSMQGLITLWSSLYRAALRARLEFVRSTLTGILSTFSKLALSLALLIVGFGSIGAMSGWLSFQVVSLIISFVFTKQLFSNKVDQTVYKKLPLDKFWSYSRLTLLTNLALTSLYSTDIVLVRNFLSGESSGIYSASSTLSKTIFFAATAIMTVAFPIFVKYKDNLKRLRKFFKLTMFFSLFFCLMGIILFKFFPTQIVNLLFGKNYQAASSIIFEFSLFMSALAIFNVIIQFLLALNNHYSVLISLPTALGQMILIIFNHQSATRIIYNSLMIILAGVLIGLIVVLKLINGNNREKAFRHCTGG
jgi:O-antigen/teichoic acid export membrane protein